MHCKSISLVRYQYIFQVNFDTEIQLTYYYNMLPRYWPALLSSKFSLTSKKTLYCNWRPPNKPFANTYDGTIAVRPRIPFDRIT